MQERDLGIDGDEVGCVGGKIAKKKEGGLKRCRNTSKWWKSMIHCNCKSDGNHGYHIGWLE